jgi:FkbM family methyltransferase
MKLEEVRASFDNGKLEKPEYIEQMHIIHQSLFDYSKWIGKTDVQKIEISASNLLITTKFKNANYSGYGPTFVCNPDDERIAPIEILNFFHYEEDEYNMVCNLIGDGDTVFDIGGNIGFYSIHLSYQFPNSNFFAFEPIPNTFSYLKGNVELNKLKNIKFFNWGLSREEEELNFFFYPEGSGNASITDLSERDNVVEVRAYVKKLDDVWDEIGAKTVDFIKCDVEGAEYFVFQGGENVIREHTPIVFTEMLRKWAAKFEYHPNAIIDFFSKVG